MSTITLGSNTYTLVALPSYPGFADITPSMTDSVAVVPSPYVPSQVQTQKWPGADGWGMQATLPKMTDLTVGPWIAFFGALRGRANVFQLGDPRRPRPLGAAKGAPQVDGTISGGNAYATEVLYTKGWLPSIYRQLLPGDYMQVGYRFHVVCGQVDSDSSGKAAIPVFPSLRETPADGTPIVLINPVGVFRLSSNKRQWHTTVDHLSQASVQCSEAR
jgi:hypothetical protein